MSFREQLMSALGAAVDHFNSGMSDTDAVIKAASDFDFNKDQAQRLVETFNTAKSVYFFKSADDRRQSFPLVDPADVAAALFASAPAATTKAASDESFQLRDYSFYDRPEPYYDGQFDLDKSGMQKFDWEEVKVSAADFTLDSLHYSLRKHANTTKQIAERCKSTADECQYRYDDALHKIALYVKRDWHDPQRLSNVEHYFWSKFGQEMSEPVVEDLLRHLPDDYREKRATAAMGRLPSSFDDTNPKIANLAEEALSARFNKAAMQALSDEFRKEAEAMMDEWEKLACISAPHNPIDDFINPAIGVKSAQAGQPAAPPKPKKPTSPVGSALETTFKGLGGSVSEAVKEPLQGATKALLSGDADEEQKLTDRMRNLQRQLVLEDLITNDPVLSGEDPALVAQAYKTLIDLAPDVSLKKEIARSVIRASVNAVSMSPFDAKALVDLENEIQKQMSLGDKTKR